MRGGRAGESSAERNRRRSLFSREERAASLSLWPSPSCSGRSPPLRQLFSNWMRRSRESSFKLSFLACHRRAYCLSPSWHVGMNQGGDREIILITPLFLPVSFVNCPPRYVPIVFFLREGRCFTEDRTLPLQYSGPEILIKRHDGIL